MCELLMHEAYSSKFYCYKRQGLQRIYSQYNCICLLLYRMGYLTIALLSSTLIFLTVANAQEYFYVENDLEPNVRVRRDVGGFIMQRNNEEFKENIRFRRDDEAARHRRQGHGNGVGGHEGITGPVHTFVKTDEHAHFKWGVRHHVGHEYAGRR